MNTFGQRVRAMRLRKGMAQNKLARAAGVSPASLNLLEKGRNKMARADVALRMAAKLEVDPQWLVFGQTDNNQAPIIEANALARVIRNCDASIKRMHLSISEERRAAVIAAMYYMVTDPSLPKAEEETIFGLSMALSKSERNQ